MRATKNAATAAAIGTWAILLTAFVVTILYVGRQLLIQLALAAMLTFLLAPLNRRAAPRRGHASEVCRVAC